MKNHAIRKAPRPADDPQMRGSRSRDPKSGRLRAVHAGQSITANPSLRARARDLFEVDLGSYSTVGQLRKIFDGLSIHKIANMGAPARAVYLGAAGYVDTVAQIAMALAEGKGAPAPEGALVPIVERYNAIERFGSLPRIDAAEVPEQTRASVIEAIGSEHLAALYFVRIPVGPRGTTYAAVHEADGRGEFAVSDRSGVLLGYGSYTVAPDGRRSGPILWE